MRREVLGGTPTTETIIHVDDNEMIIEERTHEWAVRAILDHNKKVLSAGLHNKQAHGRLAATIPTVTYLKWRKEWKERHRDKWEWDTFLAMRLNSNEWKFLRTSEGKI